MSADYPRPGADTAADFAARTLPLLQALDAVLAEDEAGLAQVMAVADLQRPGATAALATALAAEAEHLRALTRRTEAAVARLRGLKSRPHTACGSPVAPTHDRPQG